MDIPPANADTIQPVDCWYTLSATRPPGHGTPEETKLSPVVGTVKAGTKRGNPDFVSSSFYVPKKINLRFDRAILTLKANGFEVDRSDILSVLMDRFATAVDAAEQQGEEMDFESVLATASENLLDDTAAVSGMVGQMKASVALIKEQAKEQVAEFEKLKQEISAMTSQGE